MLLILPLLLGGGGGRIKGGRVLQVRKYFADEGENHAGLSLAARLGAERDCG